MPYLEVEVAVLGFTYKIRCKKDSEWALLEAADTLEKMSSHLKVKYPKADNQSLLLMAALNAISKNTKMKKSEQENSIKIEHLIVAISNTVADDE